MSPEQARGEHSRVGRQSDVYALGATLYELLAGSRPYAALSAVDTLLATAEGTPPPPACKINPAASPALSAVCEKAMAPSPEGRYASALELAAEVERSLADEPVLAYAEPWPARLGRWARRNRMLVAAAAVLLLLAVPLAGALAWVSDSARRKALDDAAEIERKRGEADEARKTALHNAERSQRIRDFYEQYVLKAARPGGEGLGPEVTLREAVDKARAAAKTAFAGLPEDEAAVCTALAETYARLGAVKPARDLQRQAVAAMTRVPGLREVDIAEAEAGLAFLLAMGGRPREAIPLLRTQIDRLKTLAGPNDRRTLTARNNLGYAHNEAGEFKEAERVLRDTLKRRQKVRASSKDLGATMNNLAYSLSSQSPKEALRILDELLALKGLAQDSRHRLQARVNRALVLTRLNRQAEALKEYQDLYPLASTALGPTGQITLQCLNNIGFILNNQKRFKEAKDVLAKLLKLRTEAMGEAHKDTLITRFNLAFALHGMKEYRLCVAEWEATLPLMRKTFGPRSQSTKTCVKMLLQAYFDMGDMANARRMKKQLDEIDGP
jgi:tetratricopeptide (TPR) repeat protein